MSQVGRLERTSGTEIFADMNNEEEALESPPAPLATLPGLGREETERILGDFRKRLAEEPTDGVLADIRQWLRQEPLQERGFALLGEGYEKGGRVGESVVAFERAMQLKTLASARRPAEAIRRLGNLREAKASPGKVLVLDGYAFVNLVCQVTRAGRILCGRSLDGSAFLRILRDPGEGGEAAWEKDLGILGDLTKRNCQTSPALLSEGFVRLNDIGHLLPEETAVTDTRQGGPVPMRYAIEEYLTSIRGYRFADLALALLEQQALGIYHGNLHPSKIHYDPEKGLCRFRSFDQAQRLDEEQRRLKPRAYVQWMNDFHSGDREAGTKSFLHHYKGVDLERDFWSYFTNGALDLAWTEVFRKQLTTGASGRVHHTHHGDRVRIKGERGIDGRRKLLEEIPFREGESVADIGCASGLVCEVLADRGCLVTGVDMDRKLMRGNRILANIHGRSIEYHGLDVEHEKLPGRYDTLLLFSTFHHFLWPERTAGRLAAHCRERIIVESPLQAKGAKWVGGRLETSEGIHCHSAEELACRLEQLFTGFVLEKDYGKVDSGRQVLELRRRETE